VVGGGPSVFLFHFHVCFPHRAFFSPPVATSESPPLFLSPFALAAPPCAQYEFFCYSFSHPFDHFFLLPPLPPLLFLFLRSFYLLSKSHDPSLLLFFFFFLLVFPCVPFSLPVSRFFNSSSLVFPEPTSFFRCTLVLPSPFSAAALRGRWPHFLFSPNAVVFKITAFFFSTGAFFLFDPCPDLNCGHF